MMRRKLPGERLRYSAATFSLKRRRVGLLSRFVMPSRAYLATLWQCSKFTRVSQSLAVNSGYLNRQSALDTPIVYGLASNGQCAGRVREQI